MEKRFTYEDGYEDGCNSKQEEILEKLTEMEENYRAEIADKDCMQDDPFSDGILSAMFSVIQTIKQM